jgi:hypothetical protein
MYSTLCVVEADTTELCKSLDPIHLINSRTTFYQIDFEVVLVLGLTELKAYICWKENASSHIN